MTAKPIDDVLSLRCKKVNCTLQQLKFKLPSGISSKVTMQHAALLHNSYIYYLNILLFFFFSLFCMLYCVPMYLPLCYLCQRSQAFLLILVQFFLILVKFLVFYVCFYVCQLIVIISTMMMMMIFQCYSQENSKIYRNISIHFSADLGNNLRDNCLDFGFVLDCCPDPGIF